MNGVEQIAKERKEQIEKHGFTVNSDLKNNGRMQLSFAAALLSAPEPKRFGSDMNAFGCPIGWDSKQWLKMIEKPYKKRLAIAGALLAAEIDRVEKLEQ